MGPARTVLLGSILGPDVLDRGIPAAAASRSSAPHGTSHWSIMGLTMWSAMCRCADGSLLFGGGVGGRACEKHTHANDLHRRAGNKCKLETTERGSPTTIAHAHYTPAQMPQVDMALHIVLLRRLCLTPRPRARE